MSGDNLAKVHDALRALGSRSVGHDWTCPLPGHDDRRPSLGVRKGANGGIVFKCVPCESEFDNRTKFVGALLDRLGLDWSVARAPGAANEPPPGQRFLDEVYDYKDLSGHVRFFVARMDPKDFRQGVYNNAMPGGCQWWLPDGLELLPYRLPELAKALAADDLVLVVEGERDVHAAEKAGIAATTAPGGGKKWLDSYSEYFRGSSSRVVVVADRDPTGEAHALGVVESLRRVDVQAEVRQSAVEEKGSDLRDHLDAGHTVDDLVPVRVEDLRSGEEAERDERVRERAEHFVAEADARRMAAALVAERAGYAVPEFAIRTPAEIAVPVPPMEFLVEGLWPARSHGAIGGPKKSLKSFNADVLALAVATGKPAFGQFAVAEPQPAFLFVGEGGEEPRRARLQRLAQDLFGCDLGDTQLHLSAYAAPLDSDDFKRAVGKVRDNVDPALIVLDSLYCFHPPGVAAGNLYERGPMLFGLSATVGQDTALMVVDHFNKSSSGIDLDRLAQAGMAQWADSWLLLEHRQDPEPSAGAFYLRGNVGSRQWGERTYVLDWNIGRFDPATRDFLTPVEVEVREDAYSRKEQAAHQADRVTATLLTLLDAEPTTYTRNEIEAKVCELVKVGPKKFREIWDDLAADGLIESTKGPHKEGAKTVRRDLWRRAEGAGAVMRIEGAP